MEYPFYGFALSIFKHVFFISNITSLLLRSVPWKPSYRCITFHEV